MSIFLNILSWFNLPSLTDTYTSPGVGTTTGVINLATNYSSGFFNSLVFILIGVAVGVPIGVLAVKWLISLIRKNVAKPLLPLTFNPTYASVRRGKGINTYGINSSYQRTHHINRRYRGSF